MSERGVTGRYHIRPLRVVATHREATKPRDREAEFALRTLRRKHNEDADDMSESE
ncbi:MAG: hypothetical protein IKL02_10865 [Kiritimatiellae bacterium]|nr:hypothetical protein [Kiritimatiellia bacterium]